jgi:hypothetical protein
MSDIRIAKEFFLEQVNHCSSEPLRSEIMTLAKHFEFLGEQHGIVIGEQQEKLQTALRLSKMGFDKEKIRQATNLSFSEIEKALALESKRITSTLAKIYFYRVNKHCSDHEIHATIAESAHCQTLAIYNSSALPVPSDLVHEASEY